MYITQIAMHTKFEIDFLFLPQIGRRRIIFGNLKSFPVMKKSKYVNVYVDNENSNADYVWNNYKPQITMFGYPKSPVGSLFLKIISFRKFRQSKGKINESLCRLQI